MLKLKVQLFTVLVLLATPIANAQENGAALAEAKMCFACHQLDKASLGPSWRAIASRHAPRKAQMTGVLASKIINGGGGNWGQIPMVPNQRVSKAEATLLAEWVLAQEQN